MPIPLHEVSKKSSGDEQFTSKKVHSSSDRDTENFKGASTVVLTDNYWTTKHLNIPVKPNSNLCKYFHHASKDIVRGELGPPFLERGKVWKTQFYQKAS